MVSNSLPRYSYTAYHYDYVHNMITSLSKFKKENNHTGLPI